MKHICFRQWQVYSCSGKRAETWWKKSGGEILVALFDKERISLYNFTCLHSKSFTERNVLGTISLPHCHNSSLNSKFPVVQTHGFGGSFFQTIALVFTWYNRRKTKMQSNLHYYNFFCELQYCCVAKFDTDLITNDGKLNLLPIFRFDQI